MLPLILNVGIFSALLFLAICLESSATRNTSTRVHPNVTSIVSRYLIVAIAAFPGNTFVKLREAERGLQRVGMKLLASAGVFSGKTYLSEILISAFLSIALLGLFAARRWTLRLLRKETKLTASNTGAESSEG